MPNSDTTLSWCNGADDWDENDNDAMNGNVSNTDNPFNPNNLQRFSDEDDESNSFEVETVEQALENLQIFDAHNANLSPVQGAMGEAIPPPPVAELEGGDEPGLVTVDTPTGPIHDLHILLDQTAELPPDIRNRLLLEPLQFIPKYIYVENESKSLLDHLDDHVTELLTKYGRENNQDMDGSGIEGGGNAAGGEDEQYEEATPAHGDRLFHAFLTRLRLNPGQILRYSRDEPPLLGAPLPTNASTPDGAAIPRTCRRCGNRLICELQLTPSFAETLQLLPSNIQLSHLHFLSVLIFTCSQSCWQSGDNFVTETIIFQPEI
ncbi:Programmed cell death protein 2-like [Eumeta japonica]|uniref:Programmed cell death protein 2-like n=1 Tax=Eumeta variegata TaxID=151549 RepID=A0A4C1SU52_EUMVA|nr:Programmed cell death protein 2-like [Eumeta japonica]